MKLLKYLENAKGRELAEQVGVSAVQISQWAHGVKQVPVERCIQIERVTCGAVCCEELRPDIAWWVVRRGKGPI